ncbi:MAG: BlaI/MecI/CopY family transcriptional regulator [Bacteroidales bacterium]|nr:BlaI/MecI/CopY family transcriptional regulator [Bacteroidales bacterium]
MNELTKAEEQVMQIVWKIEKGFVKDVIEYFDAPKPAYNTVSTIIRILETKGFIGHKAYGKTHEYFPLISKKEYTKSFFSGFLKKYFSNSFQQLVSFFSNENEMSIEEMEKIMKMMQSEIDLKKEKK